MCRGFALDDEEEQLTPLGRLLVLVDGAPRCSCGGNCETLQFLVKRLIEAESHEQWLLLSEERKRLDTEEGAKGRDPGTLMRWFQED